MTAQLTLPLTSEERAAIAKDKRKVELYSRYVPTTPQGREYQQQLRPAQYTAVYRHKPNPSITLT